MNINKNLINVRRDWFGLCAATLDKSHKSAILRMSVTIKDYQECGEGFGPMTRRQLATLINAVRCQIRPQWGEIIINKPPVTGGYVFMVKYPYLVIRAMSGVYAPRALPQGTGDVDAVSEALKLSRHYNRKVCAVLAADRSVYVEPDGSCKQMNEMPSGGIAI